MKPSLRRHLICPICRIPQLELQALYVQDHEVLEGFLNCGCGATYPIIGGVPRLLPPSLLANLTKDYPNFCRRHPIPAWVDQLDRATEIQHHTQDAFGYEWTWSHDYHADNFLDWLPEGKTPTELFAGKTGLEIGCGAGRHAALVSELASEHIAVDLSRAVDSAFALTQHRSNCHIVQADAYHLPFREASFDYVYCLGVLQHMHDPPVGFTCLARYPQEGGLLLVNVYQASRPAITALLAAVRTVSTRLPQAITALLSLVAGVVDYYVFTLPWKLLKRSPLNRIIRPFVPTRVDEYARHDFHTCYTDWYDRLSCPVKRHYRREQLLSWYRSNGYTDVIITPYWKAFWNACGQRHAN